MKILEVEDVRKSYTLYGKEKVPVLHGLNLSFQTGEFVSILGESGCGKSTLMNIIGGMDSDYEGNVVVRGQNLSEMTEKEMDDYRKNNVGFVFQNFNLIPHLSVLENVTIAMQMTDTEVKERTRRAIDILTEVGLKEHLHKRPNQLSGGQKQRVSIARALSNNPDIILADEPTGALDRENGDQILKLLDNIAQKGVLVLAVTHSQKVADSGTRIVKMEEGRVAEDIHLRERSSAFNEPDRATSRSLGLFASFRMALQNMKLNMKRNVLVALGGSIGILSVLLMLSLGNGITTYMNDEINASMDPLLVDMTKPSAASKDLQGPQALMAPGESFTKDDIEKIRQFPNVDHIETITSITGKSTMVYNEQSMALSQLTTLTDSFDPALIEKGALPADNQMLLPKTAADQLSGNQAESMIGKTVTLYINEMDANHKPVTLEKKLTVSGLYEAAEPRSPMQQTPGYIPAQTLENLYSGHDITIGPIQVNAYATDMKYVNDINKAAVDAGFTGSQKAKIMENITTYVSMATIVLAGIAGISLIVSGIMILVVLYISVVERTKEIGILRAIGARKKDIRRIFFSESALLGAFSGIIAVIAALGLSYVLNILLEQAFGAELIHLSGNYMLFGFVVSTGISVIAGLMPSSKAAKLDPMESLRYE
ncbi:ABC-type lipoprotein export system ATPase subunit/ABC-type antimicrobial peptide transport system permease subunit [Paenibacillus sp. JGP012]|uniref:ABC transporter ATP-binding protein/permease n=1 Tax=Paenibacillus sp. JGP012 TaxID=2735914 RepID=UPI00160E62F2|nr:ABC transporter ATP-binding protein/permease [Paenibacillus sp. JGP012]MBB6023859.1 ABC-type lipoprotein export system ATPase subunit/ABC-type antimicrobial peptide transport system permease subunit [Paenibacillus sp. JGP012]